MHVFTGRTNSTHFRIWIAIAIALFALGIVWGLATPSVVGNGDLSQEQTAFGQLAELIVGLPAWAMFLVILFKNITAVLFGFVLSPFFLIMPVVSLVLNGWLIGSISPSIVSEYSAGYLLAGLLPHGIIELPALFIGEAAALGFGSIAMQSVLRRDKREQLGNSFKTYLKYLGVAAVLFVPAALIETFVTPTILKGLL